MFYTVSGSRVFPVVGFSVFFRGRIKTIVTMSNSQMHLHSENFDLCRICLLEPESNRHVKFLHIFTPSGGGVPLNQQIHEFLGVKVCELTITFLILLIIGII